MLQPGFDLLDLLARAGMQHQVVPGELGLDIARREVGAKIGPARLAAW